MRILLVHQYFLEDDDGGGSRWNEISRIWHEAGHEITVLAGMVHYMGGQSDRYNGRYFVKKVNKDGVEVIRCHVSEQYHANFAGRLWSYFSFTFSSIWAGLFHINGNYDIVLVTSPPLFVGATGLVLSFLKRIPLVFEVRDLWPESAIDTGVLTNSWLIKLAFGFEKLINKKATLINVLTPAFREKLVQIKKVPLSKIIYIPNAADFAIADEVSVDFDMAQFRAENDLTGKFVAVYVGAHGVANQLSQLLDAAEILRNSNLTLLFIGDGMQKKELIKDAQKRNLTNVRFIDPLPKKEVFKYILAADIGVSVLKKVDTFKTVYSNKTFDYFSCKKLVLLAIEGVSRQLIKDADAGLFVEPENPKQIADGILHYISHPEKVKTQGENGYRYAKKHFDRNKLALQYLKAIENLSSRRE